MKFHHFDIKYFSIIYIDRLEAVLYTNIFANITSINGTNLFDHFWEADWMTMTKKWKK